MLKSLISEYREDLFFGLALGEEGYDSLHLESKIKVYNAIENTYFWLCYLDKDFEDLGEALGYSYFALTEMFKYVLNDKATATAAEWI